MPVGLEVSVRRCVELLALGLLSIACAEAEGRGRRDPRPAPSSEESIPVAPLSGKINGKPFVARSGRYYVDQRPGYQKIDLQLFDVGSDTPCGPRAVATPTSVWLRRKGPGRIQSEKSITNVERGGKWEVNYQAHDDGRWIGNGESNALLVISRIGPDMRVEGELSACFKDDDASCVAGRFSASYCRIRVDAPVRGMEVMERPAKRGLQPLEAVGAPPVTDDRLHGDTGIAIEPRIPLIPTYPCSASDCHADRKPRSERYRLTKFHVVRNDEFSHGEDSFWCYQCHSLENIDKLVTATGELVSFDQAYRICTSCHGDKLDDWRRGVHGLVVGNWNGVKLKKSCVACHNPHDPRYPSIEPEKPPAPTQSTRAL